MLLTAESRLKYFLDAAEFSRQNIKTAKGMTLPQFKFLVKTNSR